MTRTQPQPETGVQVQLRGAAGADAADYARAKIAPLVGQQQVPVLEARVKLTLEPRPPAARPALAEAVVDLNGHAVRAEVAAATLTEAVDLLKDRLTSRLNRYAERRQTSRRHPRQDDGDPV